MDEHFNNKPTNSLAFFSSEPHACSYLENKMSTSLFADPSIAMTNQIYDRLINFGFRRSGSFVYTPNCPYCSACQSVRVPVASFSPNRSQRRANQQNVDLKIIRKPAAFEQEHFELYRRYLHTRHSGSSMENPGPDDYMNFLSSDWSNTYFYEFRDTGKSGKLNAVAVADNLTNGLSAVYTFYDPNEAKRSLGKFAILRLIEFAKEQKLDWFYLGYWIDGCQKMQYKSEYQPAEIFYNGHWKPFPQQ
jgi:arginine-tRNA-protein transferase